MILGFVKGFFSLFLLIKVLLYFVPKNVFEKYISFFAGVVLVIGILYPLMQMLGQEMFLLDNVQYEEWAETFQEVEEQARQMEENGKTYVMEHIREREKVQTTQVEIEAIKIGEEMADE